MKACRVSSDPACGIVRRYAGYRVHAHIDGVGIRVVVRAEDQGIDPRDGGRFAAICERHAALLQGTERYVRSMIAEGWCEECEAGVDRWRPTAT
jgi:hypothetical protein